MVQQFWLDYGLLLELHALRQAARSYALLNNIMLWCILHPSVQAEPGNWSTQVMSGRLERGVNAGQQEEQRYQAPYHTQGAAKCTKCSWMTSSSRNLSFGERERKPTRIQLWIKPCTFQILRQYLYQVFSCVRRVSEQYDTHMISRIPTCLYHCSPSVLNLATLI